MASRSNPHLHNLPEQLAPPEFKKKKFVKKREKSYCCFSKNNRFFPDKYYICRYRRFCRESNLMKIVMGRKVAKKYAAKQKFGDYLIDISKYVLTGILITMFFNDIASSRIVSYIVGGLLSLMTLIWGII